MAIYQQQHRNPQQIRIHLLTLRQIETDKNSTHIITHRSTWITHTHSHTKKTHYFCYSTCFPRETFELRCKLFAQFWTRISSNLQHFRSFLSNNSNRQIGRLPQCYTATFPINKRTNHIGPFKLEKILRIIFTIFDPKRKVWREEANKPKS